MSEQQKRIKTIPCNYATRFRLYFNTGHGPHGLSRHFGSSPDNPSNQDCLRCIDGDKELFFPMVSWSNDVIIIDIISKDLKNIQAQIGDKLFCHAHKIEKLGNVIF